MSLDHRLDDELKKAFNRKQPLDGDGFTARLLERVALEGTPRESPWKKLKKLAMLLEPPRLRWVAIGVTASLLLAIGMIEYNKTKPVAVNDTVTAVKTDPVPVTNDKAVENPPKNSQTAVNNTEPPRFKDVASSSTNRRLTQVRHREQRELRAEGEAAKETLMLALSIASSTLNDAQKAVHDDGLKP